MGVLSWIIFGLLAGGLAKLVVPGRDPGGCLVTMLLGIVGASVGGLIGVWVGWGEVDQFNARGLGIAMFGAVVILVAYRIAFGRAGR